MLRGGIVLSDQYELAILRELRKPLGGGWRGAVDLATATELPLYAVRAALTRLRHRRMVERGEIGHWGEFAITSHGMSELATAEQLRLVR